MQSVDVHGEMELVANDLLVLAGELVGTVDALGVPVRPVEAVLKHRDGEWVRQTYENELENFRSGVCWELKRSASSDRKSLKGNIHQSKQPQLLSLTHFD